MDLPNLGTVLGGMRLDAIAGSGGMGTVYRAHHLALDRTVALKIVAPRLANDAEFRERFRREARLAAALDHPHVVPVLHAGDADGFLYLTMRFIDGVDLARLIRTEGPLAPREAVEVIGQVASALDAAHARGLVHRDVKPANILVSRAGGRWHCYLTDFGITKEVGDPGLTQTGIALGTVDYMAPEQALGRRIDGRGDQYSLACVLFQALTGRVPFPAESQLSRVYAHIHHPPPDLRAFRRDLPPALAAVVARGMAKQPEARYPTCGAFAHAAREALGPAISGPTALTPVPDLAGGTPAPGADYRSTFATPSRRARPSRRVLLGAAGATIALAGTAGAVYIARSREPGRTTPTTPVAQLLPNPIKVGAGPRDLVGDERQLWTCDADGASVSRVDIATRAVSTYKVDGGPSMLVLGQGKAWVWNYSSAVTPVDRETGSVEALVRTNETMGYLAAGPEYLWFTVPAKGSIGRIDMRTSRFEPPLIHVGGNPGGLEVHQGKVLVVVQEERSLVTVDEASQQVTGRISLPAGIRFVTTVPAGRRYVVGSAGVAQVTGPTVTPAQVVDVREAGVLLVDDGAWLLDSDAGEVRKVGLDLRTPVGAPLTGLPATAHDLELIAGSLWLTDPAQNAVLQIKPAG